MISQCCYGVDFLTIYHYSSLAVFIKESYSLEKRKKKQKQKQKQIVGSFQLKTNIPFGLDEWIIDV